MASYDLTTETAQKLKMQLEYYFSDSNYPMDKFLRGKAAENEGYIPISVFPTFNRVKKLTDDVGLIKAVFNTIDDIEVQEDKVKRKKPIPEINNITGRSVYLKGFPCDEEDVNIESVKTFFSKYGTPLSIRLRRNKVDKKFKGSAYVEFKTEEEAQKLVLDKEVEWRPNVKLTVYSKESHINEIKESKKQSQETEKLLKVKMAKKTEQNEKNENEKTDPKYSFVPGVLLEAKNIPKEVSTMDLKAYFSRFGTVRFADFSKPETLTAIVRFDSPDHVQIALIEIGEKKLSIQSNVIEGRLIEGEEEEKYWKDNIISRSGIRNKNNKFSGRGRGRGRPYKRPKHNPKD